MWSGDRELDPGSPQQCAVLALLLLAQGRPVTIEQLVEKLWGEAAPAAARPTARTYVSRLRRLLPGDDVDPGIQSGRGGYVLSVSPDALDLARFDALLRSSRAARDDGNPGLAVQQLREALSLWQGTALAGAKAEFVSAERERLEQLRLVASEERIALDLALGRHTEVLPEVASLSAVHPLEERLRELHMLALYRCARQADALQVYRGVRELLHRELGIEPGPELRALHQQILRADGRLDLPAVSASAGGAPRADVVERADVPDPAGAAAPICLVSADHTGEAGRGGELHRPATTSPAGARWSGQVPEPGHAPPALSPVGRPGLLAERLQAARRRCFVGRGAERTLFAAAIEGSPDMFVALFLHGPGGVGKSTLLHRLADDATAAGRTVVRVDGRTVEASVTSFEHAATAALGDANTVLLIDTFERCAELETWLREEFLPKLADGAVVVLAGRHPPSPAWRADPSWSGALLCRALGDLAPPDAGDLLESRGVPVHARESVLSRVGGYPLALSLAAEVARHSDPRASTWSPNQDIIETLLNQLVGAVPSPTHRFALHVCAHAYVTTQELLRVVMPGADAAELFSWLRVQPFIESGPAGLYPHDIVRDVLDADLRWRDPAAYESIHRGIRLHVLDGLSSRIADGAATVASMRSVRHLLRHSGVPTQYLTAHGESEAEEDRLRPTDRPALLEMTAATEGPESARIVEFWLQRQPSAFSVYRHRATGSPVAFMSWVKLRKPRDLEMESDPVVAAAWEHTHRTAQVRSGDHISVARHLVYPACYMRPSPVMDLMQVRMMAGFLNEADLAWSYVAVANPELWQPWMAYLNMTRVPHSPSVDGHQFGVFGHDWRLEPPEAWRDRHVVHELWGSDLSPLTALGRHQAPAMRWRPAGVGLATTQRELDALVS
ncbi:MAG TPA: BTAD domain-containing putative transcriptional regulator [Pseudonocardia sp.]|nr:BTAD domain-containing putative transcriptional regulator [Pseudonocardia sp.]